MSQLEHYDGARRGRVARVATYRVTFDDGSSILEHFTQAQAWVHGAVLESDGLPIESAISLVKHWNQSAKNQGNALRYSIPLVPNQKVSP